MSREFCRANFLLGVGCTRCTLILDVSSTHYYVVLLWIKNINHYTDNLVFIACYVHCLDVHCNWCIFHFDVLLLLLTWTTCLQCALLGLGLVLVYDLLQYTLSLDVSFTSSHYFIIVIERIFQFIVLPVVLVLREFISHDIENLKLRN